MDGVVSKLDSIYLFAILLCYIYLNLTTLKSKSNHEIEDAYEDCTEIQHIHTSKKSIIKNILRFIGGAAGIIIGADLLVDNGIIISKALDVSDAVIGLTVIALGTSLPELVTTILHLLKNMARWVLATF